MPTTEYSIWDYAVSYGGPSLFMTAVFVVVLPLVYFKFARPRIQRWPPRIAVLLGVWVVAWCIAYGDVLWIAREAKRLCEEEAGLRVYGTRKLEGFAGVQNGRFWLEKGFRYIEFQNRDRSIVHQELSDGAVNSTVIQEFESQYEYVFEIEKAAPKIERDIHAVRKISNGKKLGEFVEIRPYPGWIDTLVLNFFGATVKPSNCPIHDAEGRGGNRKNRYQEVIEATLFVD